MAIAQNRKYAWSNGAKYNLVLKTPKKSHPFDRLLGLLQQQHKLTPYGRIDPNKLLFGVNHKQIISSIGGGEAKEFYELDPKNPQLIKERFDEFADFLLGVINLGLHHGINVKDALVHAYKKMSTRLRLALTAANKAGIEISPNMNMNSWMKYWRTAKHQEQAREKQLELPFEGTQQENNGQRLLFKV